MTNLYSGVIEADTHQTLASKTGVTFTEGTTYTIQIRGIAYLREGTTGTGFYVDKSDPIEYTANSDDLYIKTLAPQCIVNIAG